MTERGSVTRWLPGLRAGDDAAAQALWEQYFDGLVRLARARLRGRPAGPAGSEDIALSAFDSFCRAAENGKFPQLDDRDDLWQVLVMLTARKAINAIKREHAAKRGGGVVGALAEAEIVADEPSPAFAAEVADECRALLDCLDDEQKQIALLKLEGYKNEEIAEQLGKSLSAVERKLGIIRDQWTARR